MSGKSAAPVLLLCLTGLSLLLSACSTVVDSHTQKTSLLASWQAGREAETERLLRNGLKHAEGSGDELMWLLENGIFEFNRGNLKESVRIFDRADRMMKEYDERPVISVRDASSEVGSALLNPNVLPYKGYTRDRILVPFYQALAWLGLHREEAFQVELQRMRNAQESASARQARELAAEQKHLADEQKQGAGSGISENRIRSNPNYRAAVRTMEEKARKAYGNSWNPAALFLSGIGYLRRGDWENARVDFERLYRALPNEPFLQRCYVTVLRKTGRPLPDALREVRPLTADLGRGMVYVIFANGRGAAFRQIRINLIVTGFAFPVCEYYPSPFRGLEISGGSERAVTFQLADLDAILSQEHTALLPVRIARIIVSYAVKEAASATAVALAWNADPLAGILTLAGTSLYKQLFNTADTRNWELLPKEFQFAGIPMPEDRTVRIVPLLTAGRPGNAFRVVFSPGCTSAILYLSAPGNGAVRYQKFEF